MQIMSIVLQLTIFTCTASLICFQFTTGKNEIVIDVDPTSRTSFSTIQSAIDGVPSHNEKWVFIKVKAGVYKEQVKIPRDKPFIYLKGEGIGKTRIEWDANGSMSTSATFASMADNILVSGITFVNSYNYPPKKKGNRVTQAVAARISGDKSAFYECGFLGYQDTLLDDKGRHFFKHCQIEGAVDFIFGSGQSIYETCNISMIAGTVNPSSTGYITAQARASPTDDNGFVFKHCNVTGKGNIYLGRAWRAYSRVIYYRSFLPGTVVPEGWDAWENVGHEDQLTFVEHKCEGPGSDKSKRVKWEKKLRSDDLKYFISESYIDDDGWMSNLPLNINED